MSKPLLSIMGVVVLGVVVEATSPAIAQVSRPDVDMNAPAPRLPNGRPDFSGVWARPYVPDITRSSANANGTSNATLTMTFRRPDTGHIEFGWVLDDPKTYTRPISNQRVFVLTPDVEIMEYSCMEGNLDNLLTGVITPWRPPVEED